MAPTPTFTDSFWSPDYAGGLGILFTKLNQGVQENQQILTIASMRADAEAAYSSSLGAIAPAVDRLNGVGFKRDDGASTRKAYEGVRSEMVEASRNHQKIADNIRELVVQPFGRWCDAHDNRIRNSQDDLQGKIKAHDRQADAVKKLRSTYFNKCRLVEDAEEENKLAFQEPEATGSPKASGVTTPPPKIVVQEEDEELPVELGDEVYTPEQMKKIFTHMLEIIPLGEVKVPILGTYQNCSSGTDIVDYIQKHMGAASVGYAEKVGQDLVDRGFLRLVGNVGSTFANSSKMKYQWRPRVWQITRIPEPKKSGALRRSGTAMSADSILESPVVGNLAEQLGAWNPLVNAHPNETPSERLRRESREADEKYKAGVRKLDLLRCNLEESMMDHLKFLERCELDRLKAIRSVILDFSGAISNSIPSFQSQVDNMMLYQETIQPQGDLRYMLENYRTGGFIPKVTPYENYYGSVDDQTFGVDLEARARADKKRVPLIVTAILTFLDNHYPDLEGDEARRSIWLVDVPLAATHHLRNIINNGAAIPRDVLERYDIPIVASVLKLYLLELPGKHHPALDFLRLLTLIPDSLVSSSVYEIIKTIYTTTTDAVPNPISSDSSSSTPRIKVLQSTLGQLRLNNIATLDAITTHFTRLIDLTSADEAYVQQLATALAPCVLRPKTGNAVTMDEKFAYKLIRDLFEHKEAIFGELKRQTHNQSGLLHHQTSQGREAARQRAVSNTDESDRRAKYEARMKAVTERVRDKSPAPGIRHRRDKSEGRFPVVASPTANSHVHVQGARNVTGNPAGVNRNSLDVPGSQDSSPVAARENGALHEKVEMAPVEVSVPGAFMGGGPGPHIPPPAESSEDEKENESLKMKRSALGSGGRGLSPGQRVPGRVAGMKQSLEAANREGNGNGNAGVTLTDRPMDD